LPKTNYLPQIDFAKKHITSDISTFDAASAIIRLENLIEDVVDAEKHLSPILDEMWHPAFFEFVAYYQVGFVTCLEWHAKSRLYDLFIFDPKQITASDIKQGLSDSKLLQMVSEGLTIPHLIASAFSVSSLEKYVQVTRRVLTALGGSKSINQILDSVISEDVKLGEILAELYEDRNNLVHEISLHDIGHGNIRNYRDFDEILKIGKATLKLIKAVELEITDNAPAAYPNLLDSEGYSTSPIERLSEEIKTTEDAIRDAVSSDDYQGDFTAEEWNALAEKSRNYITNEMEFIDALQLAGWQYHDVRPNILEGLLNRRLSYLDLLAKEILYEEDDTE